MNDSWSNEMNSKMKFDRPSPSLHAGYYNNYIELVNETDIVDALENQIADVRNLLDTLPDGQMNVVHPPYLWTIKQVIGHCVDTERVFGYRAANFAAGDPTPLPGFDQEQFIEQTEYDHVSLVDLIDELDNLRRSNIALMRRQTAKTWQRIGSAEGKQVTVGTIAYILVGHLQHHMQIIERRLSAIAG